MVTVAARRHPLSVGRPEAPHPGRLVVGRDHVTEGLPGSRGRHGRRRRGLRPHRLRHGAPGQLVRHHPARRHPPPPARARSVRGPGRPHRAGLRLPRRLRSRLGPAARSGSAVLPHRPDHRRLPGVRVGAVHGHAVRAHHCAGAVALRPYRRLVGLRQRGDRRPHPGPGRPGRRASRRAAAVPLARAAGSRSAPGRGPAHHRGARGPDERRGLREDRPHVDRGPGPGAALLLHRDSAPRRRHRLDPSLRRP